MQFADQEDHEHSQEYINARVYFYCEDEPLFRRLFTEQWFLKMEYNESMAELPRDEPACFTIEVPETSNLSQMLSKAIAGANALFTEIASPVRFTEDTT